eukprot:CAMPEP_0185206150 /NCGR_PEP_ID=MMETSP1140-20130426/57918_1 /TAXON_ID=298111 /ORGANISM="Pavlova sp., Strain CCMP459" /LENGTH=87 /DNA_ID=CAMNT_0027773783 /DNA_START=12 /DNA_END=275 /DNA_ORIENTATION=-
MKRHRPLQNSLADAPPGTACTPTARPRCSLQARHANAERIMGPDHGQAINPDRPSSCRSSVAYSCTPNELRMHAVCRWPGAQPAIRG